MATHLRPQACSHAGERLAVLGGLVTPASPMIEKPQKLDLRRKLLARRQADRRGPDLGREEIPPVGQEFPLCESAHRGMPTHRKLLGG